ncbi:helix-turn-helix domain-containing protein [Endothiovibrio diazotrophicus]
MSEQSIGARIKLARRMAELPTQASLLEQIPHWSPSRLGNYEAGISSPGPDDLRLIAAATGVSPCWLMFGDGPIRPNARDLQAIRHQNLCHLAEERNRTRGGLARFARKLGMDREALEGRMENPFQPVDDELARRCEAADGRTEGWMDEQHVEHDPLCQSFPDDLREVMELYSGLTSEKRKAALAMIRTLAKELGKI